MGFVSHGLIVIAVAVIFAWMWRSSRSERATPESGRMLFPAALAIRIFVWAFGIVLAFLVAFTTYRHRPQEWWVPCAFFGFFALVPFMYPPLLVVDVDGVETRGRFGRTRKILWPDVTSLQYNTGNRQFKIRDRHGHTVTHAGFNVDGETFRKEVQRCTRLPMKVLRPGN
ncbi:MAG: hypothetical protein DMG62_24465 [Acidobacteria bacterium]|nr:MAG: hypothetical protein DMG62_24465 [Acidobacteriota bacterium]